MSRLAALDLGEREKLHDLLYASLTVAAAHRRFYEENPEAHVFSVNSFHRYADGETYREFQKARRTGLLKDIGDYAYVQGIDRLVALVKLLETCLDRVDALAPRDHALFVRLSGEARNILAEVRKEAASYTTDSTEDRNPLNRFLRALEEKDEEQALNLLRN